MPKTEPAAAGEKPRTLESLVSGLSKTIKDVLGPGDRAALRRMRPESPDAPAFWRLMTVVDARGSGPAGDGVARQRYETTWAAILRALAQLGALHAHGRHLGRSLVDADMSEMRFLQLVRARGDALRGVVQRVCHMLASKGVSVDATDLARLLLSDGRSDEDQVRRRLARTYFGSTTQDKE